MLTMTRSFNKQSAKEAPLTFDFPFTPYPIQYDFMKNLYETIENRQFGIFESPTGTGKSLSIICGALRWLKDHNDNERATLETEIKHLEVIKEKLSVNTTDWLNTQAQEIETVHKLNKLRLELDQIVQYEEKIQQMKVKTKAKRKVLLQFQKQSDIVKVGTPEKDEAIVEDEDEILLDEVIASEEDDLSDEDVDDKYEPVKILICSRTHSQLSQLVGEIIKSPFGHDTRAISMSSRQKYCINSVVAKLKNVSLINEKCLDMQSRSSKNIKTDESGKVVKRKKGITSDCPYNKQQNIKELSDISLQEISDVEDLVTKAKQMKACPYYASRKAVEDAQVVLVPYNTLLHHTTRTANGIKLKNNVVIIDEAHNLLEALAQMYSSEVSYHQLEEAQKRLKCYKQKYSTRFSAPNLLCINQLIFIIARLIDILQDETPADLKTDVYTVQDFVLTAKIDNYNMFRLIKFCKDSKIAQKLHSFSERYPDEICTIEKKVDRKPREGIQQFLSSIENKTKPVKQEPFTIPEKPKPPLVFGNPFLSFISFMDSLTCAYEDGRIIVDKCQDKTLVRLRFLLLNPAAQFQDIVRSARAVIVAGGTMKPVAEFRRLFTSAGVSCQSIVEFSCDHIIPPQNILPVIVTKNLNDENLLFNFENRFKMGASIKVILQKLALSVKGGIVVFFPSYKYEEWVWQQLKDCNFGGRILFREPQDSTSVDVVLESYAKVIHKSGSAGAMMLSVVGGKLSEGLNFSDDLGRCVVVVGLPYANVNSPELKEKMKFLDRTEGYGAGQRFYEALCMKSVNQCIGRAVRHRNDYASVVLLDQRYDRLTTKNALPDWIKRSLTVANFKDALSLIDKFFIMHGKV